MNTSPKRKIEDEVSHILEKLESMDVSSKEYEQAVKNLQILCEARSKKPSRTIELEAILASVTNIAGILLILNYENLHVISSKAVSFIAKGGKL